MSRIEITDLSKTFKDTKALSRVNLHFEENTIYGLLGRKKSREAHIIPTCAFRVAAAFERGTKAAGGSDDFMA